MSSSSPPPAPASSFALPPTKIKRQYKCCECGHVTVNPRQHLEHRKDAHNHKVKIVECPYCVYACQYRQKLNRHLKLVHHVQQPSQASRLMQEQQALAFDPAPPHQNARPPPTLHLSQPHQQPLHQVQSLQHLLASLPVWSQWTLPQWAVASAAAMSALAAGRASQPATGQSPSCTLDSNYNGYAYDAPELSDPLASSEGEESEQQALQQVAAGDQESPIDLSFSRDSESQSESQFSRQCVDFI